MSTVGEIMTSNPVSVSVDTYATKVRSIFREGWFRSIPVVSGERLEGLITRGCMMNISSTKSSIDARGIMEHVKVVATPDMDTAELAKKLIKADTVQAPVVESTENMQLVGIVTVADILKKFLYNGKKPKNQTLTEIASEKVVTCSHDDLLSKVWSKMDETGFSGLPVMKKRKMIGIITRKDIINSGHARIGRESNESKSSIRVERVMKTPPVVVTPETNVREAAELIVEHDIGRIPVVKNPVYVKKEPRRAREADLIGIISREDILGSYLN